MTDYQLFLLWEDMMLLKGLISNNVYSWPTYFMQLDCFIIIVSIGIIVFFVQYL